MDRLPTGRTRPQYILGNKSSFIIDFQIYISYEQCMLFLTLYGALRCFRTPKAIWISLISYSIHRRSLRDHRCGHDRTEQTVRHRRDDTDDADEDNVAAKGSNEQRYNTKRMVLKKISSELHLLRAASVRSRETRRRCPSDGPKWSSTHRSYLRCDCGDTHGIGHQNTIWK